MYILDTDILIDYLRNYQKAIQYIEKLKPSSRNISLISEFELYKGCKNKLTENICQKFLKNFTIIPVNEDMSMTALKIYQNYHLNIDLSIPDSFIAATALMKQYQLITRNIKHFQNIAKLKVIQPYT